MAIGLTPGFYKFGIDTCIRQVVLFLKDRFASSWLVRSSNCCMRLAASIVHLAPGVPGRLVRPVRKVR
jgi:hypothetical protein